MLPLIQEANSQRSRAELGVDPMCWALAGYLPYVPNRYSQTLEMSRKHHTPSGNHRQCEETSNY